MTAERIVLLGAGRLATHLSRALKAYAPERRIVQIYSPGGHSARRLAEGLGGDVQVASRVDELDRTADCYLFAVPDTAIAEVAESLSAHGIGRDALWCTSRSYAAGGTRALSSGRSGALSSADLLRRARVGLPQGASLPRGGDPRSEDGLWRLLAVS